MLTAAAAFFTFITYKDPMNDAQTWEARTGTDRAGVSVLCGASTDGQVAVEFRTGQRLRELLNQRTIMEYRFDDGEAEKAHAIWWERRATLTGRDGWNFAQRLKTAKRLRVRFAAAYEGDVVMDIPIADPRGAIGNVMKSC